MSIFGKSKISRIANKLLLGTLIGSKAVVGVAMPVTATKTPEFTWQDVRKDMEPLGSVRGLSVTLEALLAKVTDNATDFESAITLSYTAATPSELPALDKFWTDLITARNDQDGFQKFLELRITAVSAISMNREAYLDAWLHQATFGGGYEGDGHGGGWGGGGHGGGGWGGGGHGGGGWGGGSHGGGSHGGGGHGGWGG